MITQQRLLELLDYDQNTGQFHWRNHTRNVKAVSLAGTLHRDGYWQIKVNGKAYLGHRLAWMYMTGEFPDHLMTHANKQRDDNSWDNLLELAQVYSTVSYRKARVSMLSTRIGKLQMLKEQAVLDVQKLDSTWSPG